MGVLYGLALIGMAAPDSAGFRRFALGRLSGALSLSTVSGDQAAAMLRGMGMKVTPENVLQLRNALNAEVGRLQALLRRHQGNLRVGECGQDPLSRPAADIFNAKIAAWVRESTGYIKELAGARDALHQMALGYGHTEADITHSFGLFKRDVLPEAYAQVAAQRQRQLPDRSRQLIASPPPPPERPLPGMFGGAR